MKVVRKTTKGDIARAILESIKISGFLAIAAVTPNALQMLEKFGITNFKNKGVISNARSRLVRGGYLKRNEDGYLRLTKAGEEKLRKYRLKDYELVIPRFWDGKWRVLIFDIIEERRALRDKIRNTLASIGFMRMQDSVWIFPYDCEDLITLLKADFKVGYDLLYMVVDKLEGDHIFKDYFKLK
ncbi:MAG TPA: hypothetical protein VJH63_01865 [Candidatus Paceibacterota bacterium]